MSAYAPTPDVSLRCRERSKRARTRHHHPLSYPASGHRAWSNRLEAHKI